MGEVGCINHQQYSVCVFCFLWLAAIWLKVAITRAGLPRTLIIATCEPSSRAGKEVYVAKFLAFRNFRVFECTATGSGHLRKFSNRRLFGRLSTRPCRKATSRSLEGT